MDDGDELIDIGADFVGKVTRARKAEIALGVVVVALKEEGARQLQTHAFAPGFGGQDGPEVADGCIVLLLGHGDQAEQEHRFEVIRIRLQRKRKHALGVVEPSRLDQQSCGLIVRDLLDGLCTVRACRRKRDEVYEQRGEGATSEFHG